MARSKARSRDDMEREVGLVSWTSSQWESTTSGMRMQEGVEEQVECGARARLGSGCDPGRPLHLVDRDAVSGIPEHRSAGG